MKIILTTLNAKYIHKNLALRLLYAAKPAEHNVKIIEYTIKESLDVIVNELLNENPDVLGFSCYIWNIEPILEIIEKLRVVRPDIKIILGGPEVSFDGVKYLDFGVEVVIQGEGEFVFWEYVKQIESNNYIPLEGVVTVKHKNAGFAKADILEVAKLNPYFLDFDLEQENTRYLYFETSRGCPYNCSYCLSSTDRNVRLFPVDRIIELLDQISKSNCRQVKLLDRTFNVDPERALIIAKYMEENCKNQVFQFEIVAETLSPKLLHFFTKEASPERFRFEIGVQSFNAKSLKAVGRLQDSDKLMNVIQEMQNANLTMHVDLIAGLPYEDYASFENSFNQLFSIRPEEIQLGVLKLLKGTSLRDLAKLYQFEYEKETPYTILSTKWVTKEELDRIKNAAYAVEKMYNSGKMKNIIEIVLQKGWYVSPFALFVALGIEMKKLPSPYQLHELFMIIEEVLKGNDEKEIYAIMMVDYYANIKTKPKLIKRFPIESKMRTEYFRVFMEQFNYSQNEVYNNCFIDWYYVVEEGCTIQLLHFIKGEKIAKRYLWNQKEERYTRDERNSNSIK